MTLSHVLKTHQDGIYHRNTLPHFSPSEPKPIYHLPLRHGPNHSYLIYTFRMEPLPRRPVLSLPLVIGTWGFGRETKWKNYFSNLSPSYWILFRNRGHCNDRVLMRFCYRVGRKYQESPCVGHICSSRGISASEPNHLSRRKTFDHSSVGDVFETWERSGNDWLRN